MTVPRPCLIDSNVLIYMYDDHAADNQRRAIQVFNHLVRRRRAALSTQCLTELFNGVTRRIQDRLPASDAAMLIDEVASATVVHPLTLDVVRTAVAAVGQHQISIWDALIWSVAFHNGIATVLTEDMQSQPVIAGVRYVNPFAPDFDLDSL
ncbi:MAG TPA: PIN domain-containing protein [Thermomicrobiales bacterium]|nr:PIN domain-containing protein [Thermomicrobiales bacterium]